MARSKSRHDFPTVKVAGHTRILNARKDPPDIRDRYYEPALIRLRPVLDNRGAATILDQGKEGACTGFGLAAVINQLVPKRAEQAFLASPRMLYEMAKKHDEWPGEDYAGSSCRGAIRGWKNMGVCREQDWAYVPDQPGELTIERARAARDVTLGAYYRLRAEINDYHAALNEVGALFVSANVHSGWFKPARAGATSGLAVIKPSAQSEGGHAFAIVGYNNDGVIVQNSWGKDWGSGGFALWLYEDWLDHVNDGWAFLLAIPTPRIFGLAASSSRRSATGFDGRAPKRIEIAGHFVHFDDGRFKERGNFWSTPDDVARTAQLLAASAGSKKYRHLLIYAHGGLNSPDASANRVAALKDGFKRNGIYPYHIMYDTGLAEEIKDTVMRVFMRHDQPARGLGGDLKDRLTEFSDALIEDGVRKPVTPLWDEMKRDARLPFEPRGEQPGDGAVVIRTFANALQGTGIRIHLAGHSTGAVLLGHLLAALDGLGQADLIRSCSLLAPACTIDFYKQHYAPRLGARGAVARVALPALDIYNLDNELEEDDNVAAAYRKSLLFLVSRALERDANKPLLGMQRYAKKLADKPGLAIHYSDGKSGRTRSTSHGGFDNDVHTMNAILKRILGATPEQPFTEQEMKGY
ncbi:MAG: C1 family peptidase [Gammaproteobacteria bacterium]|nr:C1 family peptidase [Gammaproteobacteria bacterium]